MSRSEEIDSSALEADEHLMDSNECQHQPNGQTVSFAFVHENGLVFDIECKFCGLSGSFLIYPHEVFWK